jgi:hypothetical protein
MAHGDPANVKSLAQNTFGGNLLIGTQLPIDDLLAQYIRKLNVKWSACIFG